MATKKIMYVNRATPHGGITAKESLDVVLISAAFDQDVALAFIDDGVYQFKLKFLGKEVVRTKFGKVECLKFRPYVQSGRVFKEQESLTLWVSNDLNKIPIRIKAELAIGSIKADLDGYNGLKNQFKIIVK